MSIRRWRTPARIPTDGRGQCSISELLPTGHCARPTSVWDLQDEFLTMKHRSIFFFDQGRALRCNVTELAWLSSRINLINHCTENDAPVHGLRKAGRVRGWVRLRPNCNKPGDMPLAGIVAAGLLTVMGMAVALGTECWLYAQQGCRRCSAVGAGLDSQNEGREAVAGNP
jgi:hypothetical protein